MVKKRREITVKIIYTDVAFIETSAKNGVNIETGFMIMLEGKGY
jgi:hypothetical protein